MRSVAHQTPVKVPVVLLHGAISATGTSFGPEPDALGLDRVDRPGERVLGHSVTSNRANRQLWNRISGAYQDDHDPRIGAAPRLWGMFSIPDQELNALGDVTSKRVLELGCGAGQWSRTLAGEGALVVGLDLSETQLAAATQAMGATRYPLVQGAAEQLPFAPSSFDVVFCDHGGLSWAPPHVVVPQAARVMRRSGRLVFNATSPWFTVCYDDEADKVTTQMR